MRRGQSILFGLGLLTSFCHAETRWCSIVGRGPSDMLVYPSVARTARVSGTVLSRIQFSPSGSVNRVEIINGSQLLAESLSSQIKGWTLKTNASGDEPCQALVLAHFQFIDGFSQLADKPAKPVAPSIYEITVETETEPYVIDNLDPFPRSMRFKMAFHRMKARIFGSHR